MSGRRRLTMAAAVLPAGLVLAGAALYRWASQDNSDVVPPPLAGVARYDVQDGQDHTKDAVQYPRTPPVGGPHNPKWQNCGFYGGTVRNELAVHSLEHGAVWITYRALSGQRVRQPAGPVRRVRLAPPAQAAQLRRGQDRRVRPGVLRW